MGRTVEKNPYVLIILVALPKYQLKFCHSYDWAGLEQQWLMVAEIHYFLSKSVFLKSGKNDVFWPCNSLLWGLSSAL